MQWFCLKILPCRIHGLQSRAISRRYSLQIARSGGTPAVCLVPLYLIVVVLSLSRVWLFATPWTVARQAPLSVGFSKQEDCSRLPCPPPGDLPDSGIKPTQVSHIPGRSCCCCCFLIVWATWEEMAICYSTSQVNRINYQNLLQDE